MAYLEGGGIFVGWSPGAGLALESWRYASGSGVCYYYCYCYSHVGPPTYCIPYRCSLLLLCIMYRHGPSDGPWGIAGQGLGLGPSGAVLISEFQTSDRAGILVS